MAKCEFDFYGIITIPEGVTEIEPEAFAFREDIHEVRLPLTMKRIGKSAFQECVNLEKINFHHGIEEIGDAAFCNCLSLVKPKLPKNVKIGELAFHHTLEKHPKKQKTFNVLHTGRFKLRKDGRLVSSYDCRRFVIPDGVREIGEECFVNESVLSIRIPNSVTSICDDALCSYKGKHITLPKALGKIGSRALSCSNLEEIVIPCSVKEISHGCFENCRKLKSVIVEEGVESIDDHAFDFCVELKRVILPKTLKKIGNYAFHWCTSLEEVVFPDGLEEIGKLAFSGCEKLIKVNVPHRAKIGSEAFWEYWKRNGMCGYCGSERNGDGCSNPNCIINKEIRK